MNIRYLKTTLLAISLTLGFSCRSGKSQLHVQGEGEAQSALKVFSNELGSWPSMLKTKPYASLLKVRMSGMEGQGRGRTLPL